MVIETIPAELQMSTLEIQLPASASAENIKRLLDALDPLVEGNEVNRTAWNHLVDVLENAQDTAWLKEWRAKGGDEEETIPFEEVLAKAGITEEDLQRDV